MGSRLLSIRKAWILKTAGLAQGRLVSTKDLLGQVLPQALVGSSSAKATIMLRRLWMFKLETWKPPGRAVGWESTLQEPGAVSHGPALPSDTRVPLLAVSVTPLWALARSGPMGAILLVRPAQHILLSSAATLGQKILETSQLSLQEGLCKTSCGHGWFPAAAAFPPTSFHGFQSALVNRSLQMQITAGHASAGAGDTRVHCSLTKPVYSTAHSHLFSWQALVFTVAHQIWILPECRGTL